MMSINLVFPECDRSSSEVNNYTLSKDELEKYNPEIRQKKDYILVQAMNKFEYNKNLKPYKNGDYTIEEEIIKMEGTRRLYKAKVRKIFSPVFENIAKQLMNPETQKKKSIKINLKQGLLNKIEEMSKTLKIDRSEMIERLLEESVIQVFSKIKN